ncbi:MAG: prenyltransferase, partial [Acidimicrobiia bacterium]|nr:prenyltransferase [Acidimicrobiia bacterium]
MSTLRAFVRLSRPHFLIGGALMFGLGAAVAGEVDTYGYVVGQFMVTAAQLTAHYVNEYADVEADRMVSERTWFSGGSGVLVDGSLARDTALQAAVASSSVAIAAATLLSARSPAASLLGLGALSISWLYSMPPVRLLGTGLGEIATSTVVTVFVPLVGSLAQTSKVASGLWWSAVILFPVHLAMMLAFELPDLDNDRAAGKAVLA